MAFSSWKMSSESGTLYVLSLDEQVKTKIILHFDSYLGEWSASGRPRGSLVAMK